MIFRVDGFLKWAKPTIHRFNDRIDIIAGVRARCRADFQLGVRLSPERFGMALAEVREVAQRLMHEDAIDYLGEEPSLILPPPWSVGVVPWEHIGRGKSYRWEGELKPMLHHMLCAGSEQGRWFGSGLTVEE